MTDFSSAGRCIFIHVDRLMLRAEGTRARIQVHYMLNKVSGFNHGQGSHLTEPRGPAPPCPMGSLLESHRQHPSSPFTLKKKDGHSSRQAPTLRLEASGSGRTEGWGDGAVGAGGMGVGGGHSDSHLGH